MNNGLFSILILCRNSIGPFAHFTPFPFLSYSMNKKPKWGENKELMNSRKDNKLCANEAGFTSMKSRDTKMPTEINSLEKWK